MGELPGKGMRAEGRRWIVLLPLLIFVAGTANAITFTDDFNGYMENTIKIIQPTNRQNQWTINYNIASKSNNTTFLRDSIGGIKAVVNRTLNPAETRASMESTTIVSVPDADFSDFNATGHVLYWLYIDKNTVGINSNGVDLRFGGVTDYYFYRVFNTLGGGSIVPGWNLIRFDLNNALITIGTPNLASVTRVEFSVVDDLGAPDTNFVINKIWAEMEPNAFNGNWKQEYIDGTAVGWGVPDFVTDDNILNLANNDDNRFSSNARIFIPSVSRSAVNSGGYSIHFQTDVNQVDANIATRMFFDYVDANNYSAVFIDDTNYPATTLGVEQYVAGVRTFTETASTFTYNTYYTLAFDVNGTTVSVYKNSVLTHTGSIVSRVNGDIGLGVQRNRAQFDSVSVTLTAIPASTNTTTFTFNVPTSRATTHSIQAPCTATAFFFNERDANYDPDDDGNAARVKPRATRATDPPVLFDWNYAGVVQATAGPPEAYLTTDIAVPTDLTFPADETSDYSSIARDDDDAVFLYTLSDSKYSVARFVFNTATANTQAGKIKDLNFLFIGQSTTDPDCTNGTGEEDNITIQFWNNQTSTWDIKKIIPGGGSGNGDLGKRYGEVYLDTNFQQYIKNDQNILVQVYGGLSPTDNSGTCFFVDQAKLKTRLLQNNNDFCQSNTVAAVSVLNSGNTTISMDGNFASAFAGVDVNLVLKVWTTGGGQFCGQVSDGNGLTGWEATCSITDTSTAVTSTSCKQWSQSNATTASRLATGIAVGARARFCYSGDFSGFVSAGDHNQTWQIGTDYST